MTDEELVEKVAKAMFPHSIYNGYDDETKRRLWMQEQRGLKTYARAAIAAMKEAGWTGPKGERNG